MLVTAETANVASGHDVNVAVKINAGGTAGTAGTIGSPGTAERS